jgi:PAS domain S-box-containing protein
MTAPDRYQILYDISRTLHSNRLDLQLTLQTVISMTGQALGIQHGCLMTFHEDASIANVYVIGASDKTGLDEHLWNTLFKQGPVGYVYHSDRTVVIRNIQTDPRWSLMPRDVSFIPLTGSAISVPLGQGTDIAGVMLLIHPTVDYFTRQRVELLEEIASLASLAIRNARDLHAIRVGNTRYRALFDEAVVPMLLTDISGIIVDVNWKACDFLGYRRTDLLHIPIADINQEAAQKAQFADLKDDQEEFVRATIYNIDGRSIPSLVRVRRVQLEGRPVIEWVMQDMSAQTELEQLRRDMSAMVYHDLRGPLTNILGGIYKLGEVLQNHENPLVLKLLHIALRSTRQLQRLVDSLLDIQRMEEGKKMLNRQPIEVRVMVTDAVQLVQPLAAEAGQVLMFDVARDLPTAQLDSDMLMRVLVNLIENAVKYTPTEGSIHVNARLDDTGNHIIFKVSDSGPGIPPDMLGRIFEKFSRVKYQNAPKGVGLGLAFCRLAVEAHGGRIWVESEMGKGSDFIFQVPLREPSEADKGVAPAEKAKDKDALNPPPAKAASA